MKTGLVAVALLVTACSHATRSNSSSPTAEAPTTVKVVNDNVVDMNVFVRSNAQLFRLGRVTGGHTEVFTIPPAIVHFQTTLTFEMRPTDGSARARSDIVTVNQGDQVTLMISP
jgi:hypothetical protein